MTSTSEPSSPSDRLSTDADSALQRLVGIETLKQSGRLAGLAGGVLLLLSALLAGLGNTESGLGNYWLVWAASAALLAAFGGPLGAKQLLSREHLTQWRLALVGVMSLNSSAWVFASVSAVAAEPNAILPLVLAALALALCLLPTLFWPLGLVLQLVVHLICILVFSVLTGDAAQAIPLPLGLWASLALLALVGMGHARRVEISQADAHCLRLESAELQRELFESQALLQEVTESRRTVEAELAEILDLAEDANRAKTEFLATMSHEIRTPLNGILPILEMLRDTELDDEQLRLVSTAKNSSRHLLRIINDILDFAKVESGKLQLEAIEIDIRELVSSVTELMSGSAKKRSLKLSASVADNVPNVVRGDPIRLRQILINLVSNAIKFTEEGGIRVEVSRGQSSQKEVELLFAVADTGIGMSPETSDRLFQLFTQADASTTRKHGGTGLGLVISKRLVELMGGKIGVRSTLGHGSTFWFLVPLRKSVTEVPSARRSLQGVRILSLIHDEDVSARVSELLRGWGVALEATDNPQDAVATLRSTAMLGDSWRFGLALIDAHGLERRLPSLLTEIRAADELKELNILVSVATETLAHKLKQTYGVYVLSDILRPEPLRRMLHRLFDVESRHFGTTDIQPGEVYDDLNVSVEDIGLRDEVAQGDDDMAAVRVLLVEDNPVNQGVILKVLSKLGMRCETAADGEEAVRLCQQQRYDMVFMDCQMPVMDGYEATAQIRKLENEGQRLPMPIIAMTANAMEGDREKCLDAGMDDYLPKPVSLEQLRNTVRDWLFTTGGGNTVPKVVDEASPAGVSRSVLDETVLAELKVIMEDEYLNLLATYLRNAPTLLDDVREAVENGDVQAMVIPYHSLKSSSANVGAMPLSELARDAEHLARSGDLVAASGAFGGVEAAFESARKALLEHMAKNGAA